MKTKLLGGKIRGKIEFLRVKKRRGGWEEKFSFLLELFFLPLFLTHP
jgi:hypothetical protein